MVIFACNQYFMIIIEMLYIIFFLVSLQNSVFILLL